MTRQEAIENIEKIPIVKIDRQRERMKCDLSEALEMAIKALKEYEEDDLK